MSFEIEIKEGHDSGGYFWIRPVRIEHVSKITWDEVERLAEEISIEEGDVDCFLAYFFYKHFDNEMYYNKHRFEMGYITEFQWYLTFNFFTYDAMRNMLADIENVIMLLENDSSNQLLIPVKESFSIIYMCESSHEDYINKNEEAIDDHIDVVIDFYKRFVYRIRKMMDNNPQVDVLSIMGP